jgi:dUTP pyrophosphatase
MCTNDVAHFKFAIADGLGAEFLPTRANENDTGWDVRAAEDVIVRPFSTVKIPLGVRCFAPEGWWLELRPRSSTMAKKNLHCLYGVIDEGFENQILLAATWVPQFLSNDQIGFYINLAQYLGQELKIEKGERIGQLIPVKRNTVSMEAVSTEEFDNLCKVRAGKRGLGGFGSTGG